LETALVVVAFECETFDEHQDSIANPAYDSEVSKPPSILIHDHQFQVLKTP